MRRESEHVVQEQQRRGLGARHRSAWRPHRARVALSVLGVTAIAIPVAPAIARGDTCGSRLVTVVILGSCENNGPGTVIAQQQQQQAAGGGGGGGAASSSSSGASGAGSGSGPPRERSAPTGSAADDRSPTLTRGMDPNRTAVRRLQGLLRGAGLRDVPLNGRYDVATRSAVRRFQRKNSIPTDSRTTVGPTTWERLERINRRGSRERR